MLAGDIRRHWKPEESLQCECGSRSIRSRYDLGTTIATPSSRRLLVRRGNSNHSLRPAPLEGAPQGPKLAVLLVPPQLRSGDQAWLDSPASSFTQKPQSLVYSCRESGVLQKLVHSVGCSRKGVGRRVVEVFLGAPLIVNVTRAHPGCRIFYVNCSFGAAVYPTVHELRTVLTEHMGLPRS